MRTPRRNFTIGALSIVATLAAVAVGLHAQDVTITGPTSAATSVRRDSSDAWWAQDFMLVTPIVVATACNMLRASCAAP